jgi:hypothetical protein
VGYRSNKHVWRESSAETGFVYYLLSRTTEIGHSFKTGGKLMTNVKEVIANDDRPIKLTTLLVSPIKPVQPDVLHARVSKRAVAASPRFVIDFSEERVVPFPCKHE